LFKLKLPSLAEAFHAYYEVVNKIDSWLTPRPPLKVTVPTPISASTLPAVAVGMADALAQTHPDEEVTINLPPNVRSTPVVTKGVKAHAERSDNVNFITTVRGTDRDAYKFEPAEHNDHSNGENATS
jgi:hypothetical protein